MRAACVASLVVVVVVAGGCGVSVTGDFQGVPFQPTSTIVAVADRHELLDRSGAIIAVKKNDGRQTLHVLLTGAQLDGYEDWRRERAEILLELKRELATEDGILLKDIPLQRFALGETMGAVVEEGSQTGDFKVFVGAAPPADTTREQGLGSKLRVTLTPQALDALPRGGSMSAEIEVQREREAGQNGDVATGTVTLAFSTSLAPERLAESNLTVAEPVLQCMQTSGPAHTGSCRDVDELPYLDETGLVNP